MHARCESGGEVMIRGKECLTYDDRCLFQDYVGGLLWVVGSMGRLLNQGRGLLVNKSAARAMRTIRSGAELASLNVVRTGGVI